jgi:hypothetical protein
MPKSVECNTHGQNRAAFVCAHLHQTLNDKIPRGINWFIDAGDDGSRADGDLQAFCDDCWTCDAKEFERRTADGPTLICQGCLERIAAFNGTWLEFET